MDKTERGTMLKKCALIVVGAVLYAAGMGLFLSPNHLAPGGVTGIAVILNSAFGLPTGITAFVLNIPLFLIAIKAFGFRFFLPRSRRRRWLPCSSTCSTRCRSRRTTFCWPRLRAAR